MLPGFDLEQVLLSGGAMVALFAMFLIIFAESGLFFGFFLPGDSLLLAAGVISAAHPETFPLWAVCAVCFVAAVLGDAVGYGFGHRYGRRLYERPDSRFFKKAHLRAAEAFYEKHGGKTIVIARFMPFVRTFAPIVAGAARMSYRRFAVFNFTGAALWAIGLPVAGYALGSVIEPAILDRYLLLILAIVVALSLLPSIIHVYRSNREEIHARVRSRGREGAARPVSEEPPA
jgi:membrane-associated protein